ncbi:Structural maintenance of chromosomes protein 4, partial [Stegodyphus mimosarum]
MEEEKRENSINEELKSKRMKLEEAKHSLNASQNHNALVKAFMEQKAKGKLTGVYGRLGDLGAIDEKYDVAISTACGSLDHIVTDTITTAQQCVEFIKANNLGYTTFIALDKMKKWEPYTKEKIIVPENVPRLFDLISVKDKDVLPAFYFALRNTLVAKDLEQATRVGLQSSTRYRVVTLKGELIDLSGTMSGGGGKVLKGRMGKCIADSGVSEQEVQKMSVELELLMKNAAEVKKLKSELKDVINAAEKELSSLKHSIKKTRQNYNGFLDRKNVLSTQIKEQEIKILDVVPDKQKVKELEACIEKRRKSYTKAADDAGIIEEKVKNLQDKILAVTKGKLGTAQKRIDKLNAEISQTTQGIIKCTALLKKSEKNLSKAEEKITSLQSEIETCNKARQELKEELSILEKNGLEISAKQKEAAEELEQCEMKKKFISVLVQEFSTKMHQIKSELVDHKNKVKLIEIDLRAKQGQVKGLKAQLSKLELFEDDDGPVEFPTLTHEELEEVAIGKINYEIGCIQKQMEGMNPDLGAIAEFKRKEEMYRKKLNDLEETVKERDRYRGYYEILRKHRLDEFMKGFNLITLKVKELYQMITLGGDAELELVDSLDPFAEGIEFSVRPLRKSWKSIRNLSGGEKTLSSLALVFALHYYRSTPFFVMDEIDAALDFRNVSIIGSYIKDCTKNAQFIVISLRENMFLLADHLIGIYKLNNRTRNICLSPKFVQGLVQSVMPNVSVIAKDRNVTDKNVHVEKQNSEEVEKDNKNRTAESNELSKFIELDKTTTGNRKCSFAVIDITENINSLRNGNEPTMQIEKNKNKSFKTENDQLL